MIWEGNKAYAGNICSVYHILKYHCGLIEHCKHWQLNIKRSTHFTTPPFPLLAITDGIFLCTAGDIGEPLYSKLPQRQRP